MTINLSAAWGKTPLGLAEVYGVLVAIAIWSTAVGWGGQIAVFNQSIPPGIALPLSAGIIMLFGVVLGALIYANARGLSLEWSLPDEDHWLTAGLAIIVPAMLAGVTSSVGNIGFGIPLSEMTQQWMAPNTPLQSLFLVTVLPGVVSGVGYGLLFGGVVYERVRGLVNTGDVSLVATALVGFFWIAPTDVGQIRLDPGGLFEVAVSLGVGIAFAMMIGIWYRRGQNGWSLPSADSLDLSDALVIVIGILGLVALITELVELPKSISDLMWVFALGIAIVGYDRTRSVWVPILSITLFEISIGLIVYTEAVWGLAHLP